MGHFKVFTPSLLMVPGFNVLLKYLNDVITDLEPLPNRPGLYLSMELHRTVIHPNHYFFAWHPRCHRLFSLCLVYVIPICTMRYKRVSSKKRSSGSRVQKKGPVPGKDHVTHNLTPILEIRPLRMPLSAISRPGLCLVYPPIYKRSQRL